MNIAPVPSPSAKKKAGKQMEKHAIPPHALPPNQPRFDGLIGESAPMQYLRGLIEKASHCSCPVLLLGETGTGKELVARAIHFTGSLRGKAFVTVDCSALTSTLIESELFGHVGGSFTGADRPKFGLLQTAHDGTIFLDEIGELPMPSQAKILRTIQEKEIRPVGSTEIIHISARVIAATNRDIEKGVGAGTFRQDLYFRLNVIQIKIPALRERRADIPLLVAYFLKKFSDRLQPVREISADALGQLKTYSWPGNIRELENTIECAVALSSDDILQVGDLPSKFQHMEAQSVPENNEPLGLTISRRSLSSELWKKPVAINSKPLASQALARPLSIASSKSMPEISNQPNKIRGWDTKSIGEDWSTHPTKGCPTD